MKEANGRMNKHKAYEFYISSCFTITRRVVMTGGGLYVLVAYGSQNTVLSGNPDFTFFYTVFRKYSHFSFESITIPLEGPQELFFDQTIQLRAKIKRIGDLVSDLYFSFTLPDIYSKYILNRKEYNFQWVRYIGAQIIQDASFFIGGTLVQQFDSSYIISTALTDQDETQYNKWQELIGDVPELYDPANGKYSGVAGGGTSRSGIIAGGSSQKDGLYPSVVNDPSVNVQNNSPSIPSRDITVPLGFWFTQNPALALPLVALQYHECEIQLTLRPIQDLYTVIDVSGYRVRPENRVNATPSQILQGNVNYTTSTEDGMYIRNYLTDFGYTVPTLNTWPLNPRLQATHIYVTDEERRTFATKPLNYIVRQVTRYSFSDINSRQLNDIHTHNPVPRIIILPRRQDSIRNMNNWVNYTNWWNYPAAPFSPSNSSQGITGGYSGVNMIASQQDIIRQVRILCDGNEIQEIKPMQYFRELSSWKYATGVFPPGMAIYSFALDTSKWMRPSGTLNTSRVKKFQVDVDIWPLRTDTNFLMQYDIYVESLNFLVIESGMGGMKYAS